jgi:hypothetical protein
MRPLNSESGHALLPMQHKPWREQMRFRVKVADFMKQSGGNILARFTHRSDAEDFIKNRSKGDSCIYYLEYRSGKENGNSWSIEHKVYRGKMFLPTVHNVHAEWEKSTKC